MLKYLKNALFITQPIFRLLKSNGGTPVTKISFNKTTEKCIVLGNGPSLKEDLPEILQERGKADFICVNGFPVSDSFFTLKPAYHLITDTAWWIQRPNYTDRELREKTFERLQKVDWKLQIILAGNSDAEFIKKQVKNDNIEVIKAKTVSMYRNLDRSAFKFYDTGYFGPPFTNVLVFAVFCAIMAGYKSIDIYGADLSYLFLVDVDQQNNDIFIKNEHFYNTGKKEILREHSGINANPLTLYQFLQEQAWTLKSHELMNEYAKEKGIQIFNKSSYSIIDAYKRVEENSLYMLQKYHG